MNTPIATKKHLLFPEPVCPRSGPTGYAEPSVNWFKQSTTTEAAQCRTFLNDWYAHFPDIDGNFAARLRSEDDVDHSQAVDELFAFRLLSDGDFEVRYEENGTGPDFRVYDDDALVAAVEVVSLFEKEEWSAARKRISLLVDALNEQLGPAQDWYISFDEDYGHIDFDGDLPFPSEDIAVSKCVAFLRDVLAELPSASSFDNAGSDSFLIRRFENAGQNFVFEFHPRHKPSRIVDEEIVAFRPSVGGWVNVAERLKEKIGKKKPKRYDIEGVPYVVFVVLHDPFGDEHDVANAVYGRNDFRIEGERWLRNNDGLFGLQARNRAKNSRISSVVHAALNFRNVESSVVSILENPFAAHPFPAGVMLHTKRFGIDENGEMSWQIRQGGLHGLSSARIIGS